jgi:hypothetical protein
MSPSVKLLPGAIGEIFVSASKTRKLTLGDRYGLMAAILDGSLKPEERDAVNRLLHSVWCGRLQIVEEWRCETGTSTANGFANSHSWDIEHIP